MKSFAFANKKKKLYKKLLLFSLTQIPDQRDNIARNLLYANP